MKDMVKRKKRQTTVWWKMFTNHISTQDFPLEGIKNTHQWYSIFKPPNKKRTKTQRGTWPEWVYRWQINIRRCSTSLDITGIQIKAAVRHHYRPWGQLKKEKKDKTNYWWEDGTTGTLLLRWLRCKVTELFQTSVLEVSYKVKHVLPYHLWSHSWANLPNRTENWSVCKNLFFPHMFAAAQFMITKH